MVQDEQESRREYILLRDASRDLEKEVRDAIALFVVKGAQLGMKDNSVTPLGAVANVVHVLTEISTDTLKAVGASHNAIPDIISKAAYACIKNPKYKENQGGN